MGNMVRTPEQIETFVNRMVETYPQVHNERYWKEIDPFISYLAKGQCMDLGCGPGLLLLDLFKKYQSEKLIGLDLSPLMLTKAQSFLEEAHANFSLLQQHLQENYFLPNGNNLVFSSRVLRSFEDPVQILTSIHDSLVENGLLVLLDWDRQPLSVYVNWFNDDARFHENAFSDMVKYHRNFSRYSIDDWSLLLRETGFTIEHAFQLNPVHIVVVARKE